MRKTDINKATCNTLTSEQLDILLLIFKKKNFNNEPTALKYFYIYTKYL